MYQQNTILCYTCTLCSTYGIFTEFQFRMLRLEQLCVQYLETCIGLKNVLVALQNASKMNLDFLKVRHSHVQCTTKLIYMYM